MALVNRDLYVLDTNNSDLRKINLDTHAVTTAAGTANISGTDDGHASAAHFNLPTQITTDGQNLYISDSGNNLDPPPVAGRRDGQDDRRTGPDWRKDGRTRDQVRIQRTERNRHRR